VFRSLAGSFWHWLSESAAEFGLAVDRAADLRPKCGLRPAEGQASTP
jgi:hypothetical protein